MKATELRIGNWFYGDCTNGENHKITALEILDLYDDPLDDYYQPIPLTEEWLLKFGLIQYTGWDDMKFWCREQDLNNHDRFELFEGVQGYELPSGAICKNVHTLQNCFYFHHLGEELTITE